MGFDAGTVLAAVAKHSRLGALIGSLGADYVDALIGKYTSIFSDHLETTSAKVRQYKDLIHRDEPADLKATYVPRSVSLRGAVHSEERILEDIAKGKAVALVGSAGLGKSMMMKHLTVQILDRSDRHCAIPLFIELRTMNGVSFESFDKFLFETTSSDRSLPTLEMFRVGLQQGLFLLILDGADEIDPSARSPLIRSLVDLPNRYPGTGILISTRPGTQVEHAQAFTTYRLLPLDRQEAIGFLSALPYDEELKRNFVSRLEPGFFNEYRELLGSPLLAMIMLLTFDRFADIPRKVTTFYGLAYEALFAAHDRSKGFERKHHTSLEIDEFADALAAMAYISMAASRSLMFTETELATLARKALEFCRSDEKPKRMIRDLIETLSLVIRDGFSFVYVHRSFQEYFAALFVSRMQVGDVHKAIARIVLRGQADNFLFMLNELSVDLILAHWLVPSLKSALSELDTVDFSIATGPKALVMACFDNFTLGGDGRVTEVGGGSSLQSMTCLQASIPVAPPALREILSSAFVGLRLPNDAGSKLGKLYTSELAYNDPDLQVLVAPARQVRTRLATLLQELEDWCDERRQATDLILGY